MKRKLIKILGSYLKYKASPQKIRKYINQKNIKRSTNTQEIDPKSIRVAVVQEKIQLLKSYKEFVDVMYRFVKEASESGAQLICFPENNGLLLLGLIPFSEAVLKRINSKKGNEVSTGNTEEVSESAQPDIVEIFKALTPFIKSAFKAVFSELAKAFGIYIMAGSVLIEENDKVYNRAYLFDSQGEIAGNQDKAHLLEIEAKLGFSTSECLKVFDTPIGRLAFPICMDATYFETFKILKAMGAQIVIVPIANIEEYNYYLALRGIWPRVQESGLYGLKSALVGSLYGISFTGRAGIFAPLGLTPERNGIIREAQTYDRDELLIAQLDLTLLYNHVDPYFSDTNPELYEKYLPDIYRKHYEKVLRK